MTLSRRRTPVRSLFAILALGAVMSLATAVGGWCALPAGELANQISPDRLSAHINTMASFGSRVSGYPGNAQAADYIIDRFEELGMQTMVQEFDLPTPLHEDAALEMGGASYELHGLWPNLVRTSAVPSEGLTGPVIYVGDGTLSDFNGLDAQNAIVVMDFNTGQSWLNAALLDSSAVLMIEPENTTRGEAEIKWLRVPVNVPRFWISRDDAEAVIAAAGEGTDGTVTSNVQWRSRTNRNIIGVLKGSDPELAGEAMIIEAYYDSISVVPSLSPGAENAVSIATLLELAEIYSQPQYRPDRSIIFLACSGHFNALSGAREFIELWGKEPRKIRQRRERFDELTRELTELERALETTRTELEEMEERKQALARESAGLSPAQLERRTELASRINVGQLELTDDLAYRRIDRLQADIARKRADMQFWEALNQFEKIHLFMGLDLSTHTPTLGAFQVGWYFAQAHLLRFYSPLGKQLSDDALAVTQELGLVTSGSGEQQVNQMSQYFIDGINPIKGREWHTFFPGKIAFDHEMMIRGGRAGLTFTTVNDARQFVDTPLDTPDRVNLDNLVTQNRLLVNMLHRLLNDPTLSDRALKRIEALKKMDDLNDIKGTVLEFRRRESFVPNSPVPESLVLIQGQYRIMMGVHTTVYTMGNETSEFVISGEGDSRSGILEAYNFDPDSGDINYAPDRGIDGDKKYPRDVYGRAGLKRPIIVFGCAATDLLDLVDQRYFQTLEKVFVYDGEDYSEPISYGYSINEAAQLLAAEFPSYVEPSAVVYSIPEIDVQVTMSMGLVGIRMIAINATPETPTGIGFPAATTPRIPLTPLQIANDMWLIDEFRIQRLERHGIANQRVLELHETAKLSLDVANKALADRQYDTAVAAARHAWGYESRAYPDVQKTAEDVVKGVLFYLAILLPFAFFGERLFVHARTIIGQIVGTLVVFTIVFLLLALVHPAFALTTSPPIILLAFIVMALAVLVISIVTMKFNQELKSMKQSRGGVHEADVGRLSVAGAAFGLGIANMRRRKSRTTLTAITLILLTFTVLSFTSVKSYLRSNEINLNRTPAYQGLMLRDRSWLSLEAPTADIIANELGREATVSPRAWYTSSDLEKELMVDISRTDDLTQTYTVNAILGLSPQEPEVMDVEGILTAGRWLEQGEKSVILLPESIATELNISAADVGEAEVTLFGSEFTVIGIIDETAMRQMNDLDGEAMTPVNYATLRPEVLEELKRQAQSRSQLGSSGASSLLQEYTHYGPENLAVIPYSTALEMGGTLRSIGVRFEEAETVAATVTEMMKRFALSLYAGVGEASFLFSSVGMTSASGLETMAIPILIAALIVLNTMLGSVYERTREIGIYSSLGLAPSHIGTLFLAEASVFANLGAIMGYLLGQVLAKAIQAFNLQAGVELNYSSMSAVGVTMLVVVVVLLSTIYPSRRASEIASPGIARKWELPDPEGDLLTVRLPFTVTGRDAFGVAAFLQEFFGEYVGYAGGEFLAENVRLEALGETEADGVAVKLRMWLAPYDLGVSQDFELACVPTEDEEIFLIEIRLTRLAGDITSWRKTNSLFLSSIRKQFLIWRTVPQGEKVAYADRGEKVVTEGVVVT
ncbi:MAG: M28 family peptidase [candidate division WS1 bacterium]|nr:M28 family peptidase [candidate division WS1 bacterium]